MTIYFKNRSYGLLQGESAIEKVGDKLTYSMYGETPPCSDKTRYLLKINTVPENADVIVNGIMSKSQHFYENELVEYDVSALDYMSVSDKLLLLNDTTLNIELQKIEDDVVISSEKIIDFKIHAENIICLTENNNLYISGGIVDNYVFTKVAENVKEFDMYIGSVWYTDQNNDLYGFGTNTCGQQGSGDKVRVETPVKRAENVKKFGCQNSATWYIDNNGDLYGCGSNSSGQQGDGNHGNNSVPSSADILTFTKRGSNVKDFINAHFNTLYLTNDGDLYGSGLNEHGNLGVGTTNKVLGFTKIASNVKEFACADEITYYLSNDNELYGCGNNEYGQQGSGNTTDVTKFTKRADNVKEFAIDTTNGEVVWYITNNGDLYGTGRNFDGNQSNGSSGTHSYVSEFTKRASNVKKLSCSNYTTWYIDNNNDLYGCGDGGNGQQGNGTIADVLTFTKIAENVKYIDANVNSVMLYIDNDDNLYGCGLNNYGQFGNGTTTNVKTFTKIAENVKIADSYYGVGCYITNDGDFYVAGRNDKGQLGIGTSSNAHPYYEKALVTDQYIPLKLTFNVIPENAIITINEEVIEGNVVNTQYGAKLSYTAEAEGYYSTTGEVMMLENTTLDIELKERPVGEALYMCYENPNTNSLTGIPKKYIYAKTPLNEDMNVYASASGDVATSEDELTTVGLIYQFLEFTDNEATVKTMLRSVTVTRYPDGDI